MYHQCCIVACIAACIAACIGLPLLAVEEQHLHQFLNPSCTYKAKLHTNCSALFNVYTGSSPAGMCKPAHSSTCCAEQQTSIEDSNSGKLCITICIICTEPQNQRNQSLSNRAQHQGQLPWLLRGYSVATKHFPMTLPAAPPSQPSTNPPIKLFCRQACRVSGRGVCWVSPAGHLLLSYQTKESQNILHKASPTKLKLRCSVKLFFLACTLDFRAGGALGGPC
mmetsp:Transcript_7127/g.17153  ORF Transcript_7127/g.17153 Transcript_7127/m.17153 type:complete len:223 (+) Transcript_7127:344-1012(+)